MKLFYIPTVMAALALSACQPSPAGQVEPMPAASAPAVVATACSVTDTAMYGAEASYNAAASAYIEADTAGILAEDRKAQAKPILERAFELLKQARSFYATRNAIGFCNATASLANETSNATVLLRDFN